MSNRKEKNMCKIEYDNILAFHPGFYLKELIEDMEITQDEFAKRLDISSKHLSEILSGKASVHEDVAMKLATVLGTSAGLWLNLQAKYNEKCIEIEEKKKFETEKEYANMILAAFY